jgi:hypothetical protein
MGIEHTPQSSETKKGNVTDASSKTEKGAVSTPDNLLAWAFVRAQTPAGRNAAAMRTPGGQGQ